MKVADGDMVSAYVAIPWPCDCGADIHHSADLLRYQHGDNPEHVFVLTSQELVRNATYNPQGFLGEWLARLHSYEAVSP